MFCFVCLLHSRIGNWLIMLVFFVWFFWSFFLGGGGAEKWERERGEREYLEREAGRKWKCVPILNYTMPSKLHLVVAPPQLTGISP